MPPLRCAVSEQHRPLKDVMHERPDLRDVHLDEIVQGDRARVRRALMGFERASLAIAGGQRSEAFCNLFGPVGLDGRQGCRGCEL
jgi:hypothetical protein